MRRYTFPIAAILALTFALPSFAAQDSASPQAKQNQPQKVWTNDDLDRLRAQGLISIVGPADQGTSAQISSAPAETPRPAYASKLQDPQWYADQAADLQAQLDMSKSALRDQQTALVQAADGITQPGVAMDKPSVGVTPEDGLTILEAQVTAVQTQLDQLSDLARQNNIPPGVLRS